MAEIRRGIGADNRVERLPWLEPVEDEDDYPDTGGGRRWAVVGLGLLLLLAIAVTGVIGFRHWRGAREDLGGIIRAPDGPYKVRPANAGGLAVDAGGVVAERTGTGADIDAPLALVAPEQPVVGPGSRPATAGEPAPAPAPAQPTRVILPAPPKPAPPTPKGMVAPSPAEPVASGGTVQLGAFGSEAKARAAWKSLSRRFDYLQPMAVSITAAEVNGATVYRLRASGGEPSGRVCARLQLAGEACTVIG